MIQLIQAPVLDRNGLIRNLRREESPSRVYIFEHAIDETVRNQVCERFDLTQDVDPSDAAFAWRKEIAIHRFFGIELMRVWLSGTRFSIYEDQWVNEHSGPIQSEADIDRYNWPRISGVDFSQLDWYEKNLPEEMGIIHTVHIFEIVRDLMGFETMSIALYENPAFVEEVCRRTVEFAQSLTEHLCQYRCVAAVYGADDFGFKTSLLIDPGNLRRLFLSAHKRLSEIAHSHNKLYFLHSCGKLDEIMDDIIDDVQADAKHSFEDVITPVTEAKKLWGDRISLLGGLDVDFMARSDEVSIRKRVREVLDVCLPGGGYCLGLGNWVTSYIPLDNYLVMLDEARKYTA